MLSKIFEIKLSAAVLCLFALSQSNIFAQHITTSNGERSMIQNEVRTEGGLKIDLTYRVKWEAKVCDLAKPYGKTPKSTAWITDFTVEKIYYRDEIISENEIGQANLKDGIELVYLRSGIISEFKGKESGRTEETTRVDNIIRAYPQRQNVCEGVTLHHYEISNEPHTIKIKNTDSFSGSNRYKISKNLLNKIKFKTIEKKMTKARVAANRGDKNTAQTIAMTARNMCPGGDSYNSATECEIEISEFLKSLSGERASRNNEANNLNQQAQYNVGTENRNQTTSYEKQNQETASSDYERKGEDQNENMNANIRQQAIQREAERISENTQSQLNEIDNANEALTNTINDLFDREKSAAAAMFKGAQNVVSESPELVGSAENAAGLMIGATLIGTAIDKSRENARKKELEKEKRDYIDKYKTAFDKWLDINPRVEKENYEQWIANGEKLLEFETLNFDMKVIKLKILIQKAAVANDFNEYRNAEQYIQRSIEIISEIDNNTQKVMSKFYEKIGLVSVMIAYKNYRFGSNSEISKKLLNISHNLPYQNIATHYMTGLMSYATKNKRLGKKIFLKFLEEENDRHIPLLYLLINMDTLNDSETKKYSKLLANIQPLNAHAHYHADTIDKIINAPVYFSILTIHNDKNDKCILSGDMWGNAAPKGYPIELNIQVIEPDGSFDIKKVTLQAPAMNTKNEIYKELKNCEFNYQSVSYTFSNEKHFEDLIEEYKKLVKEGIEFSYTTDERQDSNYKDTNVNNRKVQALNFNELGSIIKESYPRIYRSADIEGHVKVKFIVDKTGSVSRANISESSGYLLLDIAALKSVKQLKFLPMVKDGQAVKVEITLPVTFETYQ